MEELASEINQSIIDTVSSVVAFRDVAVTGTCHDSLDSRLKDTALGAIVRSRDLLGKLPATADRTAADRCLRLAWCAVKSATAPFHATIACDIAINQLFLAGCNAQLAAGACP